MLFLAAAVVFVGVNVVPMDAERVQLAQTVVVDEGRILAIGPVESVEVPEGAEVIYGRGRWLVPGLIDMHVHVRAEDLPRYLENGITTVRDLAGLDSVLAVARRGEGPRMYVASKLLTGPNPENPFFSRPVTRVEDAASAVDEQLARGATSIKVYDGLSRAVYDAILTAAHARGVKVAGHVTTNVPIEHAMETLDSIEHLSGYPLGGNNAALAEASRASGVWNCPTMVVYTQYVTRNMAEPQRTQYLAARRALVTALDVAGAHILAGTDAGYLVPAGTSLHDELAELVAAGLTPYEALSAATRSAGEYLGRSGRSGSDPRSDLANDDGPLAGSDPTNGTLGIVVEGAFADLVLVAENPLGNLATLRHPAGVMLRGEWISYARRRAVRP